MASAALRRSVASNIGCVAPRFPVRDGLHGRRPDPRTALRHAPSPSRLFSSFAPASPSTPPSTNHKLVPVRRKVIATWTYHVKKSFLHQKLTTEELKVLASEKPQEMTADAIRKKIQDMRRRAVLDEFYQKTIVGRCIYAMMRPYRRYSAIMEDIPIRTRVIDGLDRLLNVMCCFTASVVVFTFGWLRPRLEEFSKISAEHDRAMCTRTDKIIGDYQRSRERVRYLEGVIAAMDSVPASQHPVQEEVKEKDPDGCQANNQL